MAQVFTNVGEFRRGKGNKKTRLGPRIRTNIGTRHDEEKQTQSPNGIAINKLRNLLKNAGLSTKDADGYTGWMNRAEQIRFLNMAVLAKVLLYMHNSGNNITTISQNFSYASIIPYIDTLLPRQEIGQGGVKTKEISETELQTYRLRFAATFLRYIRYVSEVRQMAEEDLELQAEQTELIPLAIDEF